MKASLPPAALFRSATSVCNELEASPTSAGPQRFPSTPAAARRSTAQDRATNRTTGRGSSACGTSRSWTSRQCISTATTTFILELVRHQTRAAPACLPVLSLLPVRQQPHGPRFPQRILHCVEPQGSGVTDHWCAYRLDQQQPDVRARLRVLGECTCSTSRSQRFA